MRLVTTRGDGRVHINTVRLDRGAIHTRVLWELIVFGQPELTPLDGMESTSYGDAAEARAQHAAMVERLDSALFARLETP